MSPATSSVLPAASLFLAASFNVPAVTRVSPLLVNGWAPCSVWVPLPSLVRFTVPPVSVTTPSKMSLSFPVPRVSVAASTALLSTVPEPVRPLTFWS